MTKAPPVTVVAGAPAVRRARAMTRICSWLSAGIAFGVIDVPEHVSSFG